jgi:hypothetical protein
VNTISGALSSEIDSDISTHASNTDIHHNESHTITSHSDTTASGSELNELTNGSDTALHIHDSRYHSESEIDTISGSLQTQIDDKSSVQTFLDLTDTPATYSGATGKYLRVERAEFTYTPPDGDDVDFTFTESYTAPSGDAVDFEFPAATSSIIFEDAVKKHVMIKPEEVKLGDPGPVEAVIGNFSVLQFTGTSATQSVYTSWHVPTDWQTGTDVNTRIYWAPVDTASGTVVWQLTYNAVASEANEIISASGINVTISDATQNTQDELLESGNMTISGSGLALEDTIGMTIFRDPTHGSDNYTSSASLVEIEIEYTSDKLGETV